MIVRIVLWSLGDARTTIDELREKLPALDPPNAWLWNDAGERFGLVAFGDELPEAVKEAERLIGKQPEVGEEFDVV